MKTKIWDKRYSEITWKEYDKKSPVSVCPNDHRYIYIEKYKGQCYLCLTLASRGQRLFQIYESNPPSGSVRDTERRTHHVLQTG